MSDQGQHYCGYVALVGRPNVGKSTLLNYILGQKLSIVTAKPQTTRQRLAGIKTTDRGQVIYLDTPGLHRAADKAINRYMNRVARATLHDVDLVLLLIEAGRWTADDEFALRALTDIKLPIILVLNKVDLIKDKAEILEFLKRDIDSERFAKVMMITAKNGSGVAELERSVEHYLPFSQPLYDEDQITDRSERFLVAELVREQLMLRLHQELPYSIAVEVEQFTRSDKILRIGVVIWVERDGQKRIVIGKRGEVLKQVGRLARESIELLLGEKVFLQLWVKVKRSWADDQRALDSLGYRDER